jgi:hypothetical protein
MLEGVSEILRRRHGCRRKGSAGRAQELARRGQRRGHGGPLPCPAPSSSPTACLTRLTTILAALANTYAASLNFVGAESVKAIAERVERCSPPAPSSLYSKLYPFIRPALVNGAAGAVVASRGRLFSVMGFTVSGGKITAIDALVDPERLAQLELDLHGE